jgi:predicted aldo/keto reductase-like oxidoreductase
MFISVKDLTYGIDSTITYVNEAKEYHSCSESEYNQYLEKMYRKLDNIVKKLKQISSNEKLISKYEKKVEELVND